MAGPRRCGNAQGQPLSYSLDCRRHPGTRQQAELEQDEVSETPGILETIRASIPPLHRDGYKFVAISAVAALLLGMLWGPLGVLGLAATLFCAYFFRDPVRVVPTDEGLLVSPADGIVSAIEQVTPPAELGLDGETRTRISIFLSVFDVHINRTPVSGVVERSVYKHGQFLNAAGDKASEDNERCSLVIATDAGDRVGVVQIAGLVARRIVTTAREGDRLEAGERFGLIRFGSRVDVYLPPGVPALVGVGQTAVGGETVLAKRGAEGAPDLPSGRSFRRI